MHLIQNRIGQDAIVMRRVPSMSKPMVALVRLSLSGVRSAPRVWPKCLWNQHAAIGLLVILRIATSQRVVAGIPFRVAAVFGLRFHRDGRCLVFWPGKWCSLRLKLVRGSALEWNPGLNVVLLGGRGTGPPNRNVNHPMEVHRPAASVLPTSSRSCSAPGILWPAVAKHLKLVELVHSQYPCYILAVASGLPAVTQMDQPAYLFGVSKNPEFLRCDNRPGQPRWCRSNTDRLLEGSKSLQCSP